VPKQHPEVTPGTAKSLYANAVRCAEPNCDQPLYRLDPDGNRVLNSRISHICARSENGPRWDAEMDSPTNQGVGNLLVLCLFHADLIDKMDLVRRYPVDLLRKWKAVQLAEYDAAVAAGRPDAGFRLSEDEAAEVVAKSKSAVLNVTAGNNVYVGGMGGGPLGGGGGGGMIGGGFAGRGGDEPKIILNGQPGQFPGGGGGGGGVMFDPLLLANAPKAVEGVGRACVVDDTTIEGPPDGAEALRLSALILANYIATDRGLVHMIHGGWENWTVLEIPGSLTVPALCVIEAGRVEPGTYRVAVELRGPDRDVRARKCIEVNVERAGTLLRLPVTVALSAIVGPDDAGLWHVAVEVGGRRLGSIDLFVKRPAE
jgi:hypothetical protein